MQNANHSNGGKGVVAATSFSYWARRTLEWGIPAVLVSPFLPLSWPRLGVLADATFVFRTLVLILFVLAVWVAWEERLRLRWNRVVVGMVAVLAATIISTCAAVDPSRAFWGDMVRQEGLLHVFVLAAYAFACAVAFRDRVVWQRFAFAAVAVGLFAAFQAAVWPIVSYMLGGDEPSHRLWGVFVNPLYFGSVMGVTAWIAAGAAAGSTRRQGRYIFGGAAVLLAYMATMSGSRSIFLALGLSVLCAGLILLQKKTRWHAGLMLAGGVGMMGLAYVALRLIHTWAGTYLPLLSRITNTSFVDQRWQIWQVFLPAVRDRWLTGWGPENQLVAYYARFLPHLYAHTFDIFDRAHNGLLDTLLTTGMVGLISTLCLAFFLLGAWWRAWRTEGSGWALVAIGAAVFYVIYLLFAFDTVFLWTVLIPLCVTPLANKQWSVVEKKKSPVGVGVYLGGAALIWLLSVAFPFLALHQARTAYVRFQTDVRAGSAVYQSAYRLPGHVHTEVAKMWATAVREAIVLRRGDAAEVRAAGDAAWAALVTEQARHPWDPSIPLATARLLEGLTELFPEYAARIRPILEEAIKQHPLRIEPYQMLALRVLRDGQEDEAAQLLRKALQVNPEVAQTHLEYAVVLYRQGHTVRALWEVGQAGLEDGNAMDPAFRLYISLIRLRTAGSANGNGSGVVEPGNVPAE